MKTFYSFPTPIHIANILLTKLNQPNTCSSQNYCQTENAKTLIDSQKDESGNTFFFFKKKHKLQALLAQEYAEKDLLSISSPQQQMTPTPSSGPTYHYTGLILNTNFRCKGLLVKTVVSVINVN